jgi:hypothetical protein
MDELQSVAVWWSFRALGFSEGVIGRPTFVSMNQSAATACATTRPANDSMADVVPRSVHCFALDVSSRLQPDAIELDLLPCAGTFSDETVHPFANAGAPSGWPSGVLRRMRGSAVEIRRRFPLFRPGSARWWRVELGVSGSRSCFVLREPWLGRQDVELLDLKRATPQEQVTLEPWIPLLTRAARFSAFSATDAPWDHTLAADLRAVI